MRSYDCSAETHSFLKLSYYITTLFFFKVTQRCSHFHTKTEILSASGFFCMINSSQIDQWKFCLFLCFDVKFSRFNVVSLFKTNEYFFRQKIISMWYCILSIASCIPDIIWNDILFLLFWGFFRACWNYLGRCMVLM